MRLEFIKKGVGYIVMRGDAVLGEVYYANLSKEWIFYGRRAPGLSREDLDAMGAFLANLED